MRWKYHWLLSSTLSVRKVYFSLRNLKRNCHKHGFIRLGSVYHTTPLHTSLLSPESVRDVAVWRRRRKKLNIWVWFRFFWCFQFHVWRAELWTNFGIMGRVRLRETNFAVSFWTAVGYISKLRTKTSEHTSKRKDFMSFRKNSCLTWFRAIIGMYCENHRNKSTFLGSCDRASWAKYEERRPIRCNN